MGVTLLPFTLSVTDANSHIIEKRLRIQIPLPLPAATVLIPPLSLLYPSPIPPPSPPFPSFHILTHPFDVLTRGALTLAPTPSRMNEPQERRQFVDCTGFSLETWAFPCLLAVRCSLFAPVVSS